MKTHILYIIVILVITGFFLKDKFSFSRDYATIESGFISSPAKYSWNDKYILVKTVDDGTGITFSILNNQQELYQFPLNLSFSRFHYWKMYADKNNVYTYNSDIGHHLAIIWNDSIQNYEVYDYCEKEIELPNHFKKELKSKNNMEFCKSLSN